MPNLQYLSTPLSTTACPTKTSVPYLLAVSMSLTPQSRSPCTTASWL